MIGIKQKTPPPKQVVSEVKKTSPSKLDKLEQVESGEAEKIFDLLSKDFEKFIRQNEFNKYVEYALYKYNTLFLLGDPNPVIQRIGKLFNERFTDPKKKIVKELYSSKMYAENKRFDELIVESMFRQILPIEISELSKLKMELQEYKKLSQFLFSENIIDVKTFLIDELGQSDFDLFTYFIASHFYQPDIEFKSKGLSGTQAELQGFPETLGSEYVKFNEKYKDIFNK